MATTEEEDEFAAQLRRVHDTAREQLDYDAAWFERQVVNDGAVATAERLVRADEPSDGFRRLWEHGRLDLSVEAQVVQPGFAMLFTEETRARAVERLRAYDYDPLAAQGGDEG